MVPKKMFLYEAMDKLNAVGYKVTIGRSHLIIKRKYWPTSKIPIVKSVPPHVSSVSVKRLINKMKDT